MPERDIRKALKERVELHGGEIRAVSWLGRNAAPDVLALIPAIKEPTVIHGRVRYSRTGQHVFIETKAVGGQPEPHQSREHKRMRDAGCTVLVISTFEQLDAWLAP